MDTRKIFIDWVNTTFKPEFPKYPVAITTIDGVYIIHNDSQAFSPDNTLGFAANVIDYYGACRGGYPWIHPTIETKAKDMGLELQWRDTGSIVVYKQ